MGQQNPAPGFLGDKHPIIYGFLMLSTIPGGLSDFAGPSSNPAADHNTPSNRPSGGRVQQGFQPDATLDEPIWSQVGWKHGINGN
jgi:hypothetical protein